MKKSKKRGSREVPPVAFHGKTEDGDSIVGMLNLRVVIVPDGQVWFAQGLDVDYAACGSSLDDVKEAFQEGLHATVGEHLKIYGNIEKLLKPAPPNVWAEMYQSQSEGKKYRFFQVSFHECLKNVLPFQGIEYLQQEKAA